MELDLSALHDDSMERYMDVLVLYLLADSSLGDCELKRQFGAALDSGEPDQLAAVLRYFASLPDEFRARITEGDPTFDTLQQAGHGAASDAASRQRRPASA